MTKNAYELTDNVVELFVLRLFCFRSSFDYWLTKPKKNEWHRMLSPFLSFALFRLVFVNCSLFHPHIEGLCLILDTNFAFSSVGFVTRVLS